MAKYHISPVGPLIHPWLNKPDTKFNSDGLFHTDQRLSGDAAEKLAAKIEAACVAALQEHTQEMKPGEAKKWKLYVPFERIEDDETGEPTGDVVFSYKQNAKIPSKKETSGFKDVKIELRDSKDNVIDVSVWNGSEGRVMFSMRPIVMVSSKEVGVRLDFAKVQITKLASGSGGGGRGFGEVEDGFVADGEDQGFGQSADEEQGGDY
ncbi:hypothetical protein [Rhizobium sp. CECT 9324]|uniref:hypothetical protein n=1 Tax=Rhizobium sp. CECT 9324 TaxID=2845820 RepID=UPI001E404E33|nr:hypothetical protein [Rhizobium sp. CECT 9324]CAH0338385.1 hypothetical protein RHI9324_00006 [Rhizobium sp. CECT 9324]CAH0343747.1 hypothetical protein RHI9324_05484 [Rhizobium sp. CECT 9324]